MIDTLEAKITEHRQEAARAMQQAAATRNVYFRELYEAKARSHYAMAAELESMRTDPPK